MFSILQTHLNIHGPNSLFHAIHCKMKEEATEVWEREDKCMDFMLGLPPSHQPRWANVNYIYSPLNFKQH